MASMREIKQRIENVSSTAQIIKAMDSIASSKLLRARQQLESSKPIYQGLKNTIRTLSAYDRALYHPCFVKRKVKQSLYIVLSSNQGFAGGYNISVLRTALEHMEGKQERIIVVGKKGETFFRRHNKNVVATYNDVSDSEIYFAAQALAEQINQEFCDDIYQEVFVVETRFHNVLFSQPNVTRILPLQYRKPKAGTKAQLFAPSFDEVLEEALELYIHMSLFYAFAESHTSEQAARMVAMSAAGKNAEERIEALESEFHRERQAHITQDLNEIISGRTVNRKK